MEARLGVDSRLFWRCRGEAHIETAKSGGRDSVRSVFHWEEVSTWSLRGEDIGRSTRGLRSGEISPDKLPIDVIVRDGTGITLNNRSLTTLMVAGKQLL